MIVGDSTVVGVPVAITGDVDGVSVIGLSVGDDDKGVAGVVGLTKTVVGLVTVGDEVTGGVSVGLLDETTGATTTIGDDDGHPSLQQH